MSTTKKTTAPATAKGSAANPKAKTTKTTKASKAAKATKASKAKTTKTTKNTKPRTSDVSDTAAPVLAKQLRIIQNDSLLQPFATAIEGRHHRALQRISDFTSRNRRPLGDFADGYLYFGLHQTDKGWIFREWAPNATAIYLIGDFNNWQELPKFQLKRMRGVSSANNWEVRLAPDAIKHGDHFKLSIHWEGGQGERIPAWARRVVQDPVTHIHSAQVWNPQTPYVWKVKQFKPQCNPLLIYECHIGMAQEEGRVGTYVEFRDKVLPRIARDGYNCVQIMAIQEHPYYGSFGYHVSSFFAASSRFGTPEELKSLIDTAHQMGLAVIMDIVHSHSVKNENEGLANFAGDPGQYFHSDGRREHPAWDSLCFDYGKDEVIHFLLSNCKYWLEEYHFDGYRFDGVTSMLYYSHGLGESYNEYNDYYNGHQDDDAICYLTLANALVHEVNRYAITIAEEVSGMPGIAMPLAEGGYGFDYRLAMNIPDFWIKTIKECRDEDWKPSAMLWHMTNRRHDERTISYAESHDQALVGDKTIIFRLIDADMYWHFKKGDQNSNVNRGIALHKMIRLLTAGTLNGGYLNFMGNEFGHPEWIDFPRQGNNWSYQYARRQWSLVDDHSLCYHYLGDFDRDMLTLIADHRHLRINVQEIWHNDADQVLAFQRGSLLFFFNFSPTRSYTDYGFMVSHGAYEYVLNSDAVKYGGMGFNDDSIKHYTVFDPALSRSNKGWLKLYLPARTACVLRKIKE